MAELGLFKGEKTSYGRAGLFHSLMRFRDAGISRGMKINADPMAKCFVGEVDGNVRNLFL